MTDAVTVSGALTRGDVKKLTRLTRSGTVGPTAVYYAGVTAPIIAAGMGLVSDRAFHVIGFGDYWSVLFSAMIAALTGIAWYLIFMRWSYRHEAGRAGETSLETSVSATEAGLIVRRGEIETRIGWPAVRDVRNGRGFTAILPDGAEALVVPDRWFGDAAAREAFQSRVADRAGAA
ncbi:MAG: YcxB family protein [Pseudomonadota bacterium]